MRANKSSEWRLMRRARRSQHRSGATIVPLIQSIAVDETTEHGDVTVTWRNRVTLNTCTCTDRGNNVVGMLRTTGGSARWVCGEEFGQELRKTLNIMR